MVLTSSSMRYVNVRLNVAGSDFISQEELAALLAMYERRGFFDEVISLLEAGLSLERAHVCHFLFSSPIPH